MTIVATFTKIEDAYLARSHLEGSGIPAHVRDEFVVSLDWFLSHAIGGVKVEVDDGDAMRAREILHETGAATGILRCPHCDSGSVRVREMGVVTGILFFFGNLPLPIRCRTVDCRECRRSSGVEECLKAGWIGQKESGEETGPTDSPDGAHRSQDDH